MSKKIMVFHTYELLKFVKDIWDHPATKNNIWNKYNKNDVSEIDDIGIWGITENCIIEKIIKGEEQARNKERYLKNYIEWAKKYNKTNGNIGKDGRGCQYLCFMHDKISYKNGICKLTTLNIDELLFMDDLTFEKGFLIIKYMNFMDECKQYKFRCIWTKPEATPEPVKIKTKETFIINNIDELIEMKKGRDIKKFSAVFIDGIGHYEYGSDTEE
jgi:hypothetical protein